MNYKANIISTKAWWYANKKVVLCYSKNTCM